MVSAIKVKICYNRQKKSKKKFRPSPEDLKSDTPFTLNPILMALSESKALQDLCTTHKVSWANQLELVRRLWKKTRESEAYKCYLSIDNPSYQQHKDFVCDMCEQVLFEDEVLESQFEEWSIHWIDDLFVVNPALLKFLKEFSAKGIRFPVLLKDAQDDTAFMLTLFRKTILHADEYGVLIQQHAQNWELDRIAIMDIILMKMAICELTHFPGIPVKVSLNEYIEISKFYSTPKSNTFINGILDKAVDQLQAEGKIKKVGRGLMD
jgi:N utilization substance protein B